MTYKVWTPEQLEVLRARYPNERASVIASALGRETASVYNMAHKLGLKKSAEFYASPEAGRTDGQRGGATRFQKGLTPWNKGTNFTAGGRSAETRFKPGHRGGKAAALYQPIGTERTSKDGYLERKVNDDMPLQKRWRAVHLLVWEAANGPLPEGYAVSFKDGDKTHIDLDNLELLSRADLMRRNTRHNLPKPLADLIALRAAVTRQINKRRNNHEQ